MNGVSETEISPDFKWASEYDQLLEQVATSDYVETDWNKLRDMIKYKLNENIASYMSGPPPPPRPLAPMGPAEPPTQSPESASTATTLSPGTLATSSGIKFPPFPLREENQFIRNEYNAHGRAKTVLTEEEAKKMKGNICKLLHEFEGNPPFTIQRICELTVHPRAHFNSAGKFLRAFERALLVTSTIDAFPIIPPEEVDLHPSPFMSTGSLREATTPLFSPIPFLHEDARRSRSRSPPMSPLHLATSGRPHSPTAEPLAMHMSGPGSSSGSGAGNTAEDVPVLALGLVDELDDPSPGHMSEHPTALTSTTTTTSDSGATADSSTSSSATPAPQAGKPMFGGSLGDRFVKSSDSEKEEKTEASADGETMSVDEQGPEQEQDADKENVPKS